MSFSMSCPECGHSMIFADGMGGRDSLCKKCNAYFVIVEPKSAAKPAPTMARPTAGSVGNPTQAGTPIVNQAAMRMDQATGQRPSGGDDMEILRMVVVGMLLFVPALLIVAVFWKRISDLQEGGGRAWEELIVQGIGTAVMFGLTSMISSSLQLQYSIGRNGWLKVASVMFLPGTTAALFGVLLIALIKTPIAIAILVVLSMPFVLLMYAMVKWLFNVTWGQALNAMITIVVTLMLYIGVVLGIFYFISEGKKIADPTLAAQKPAPAQAEAPPPEPAPRATTPAPAAPPPIPGMETLSPEEVAYVQKVKGREMVIRNFIKSTPEQREMMMRLSETRSLAGSELGLYVAEKCKIEVNIIEGLRLVARYYDPAMHAKVSSQLGPMAASHPNANVQKAAKSTLAEWDLSLKLGRLPSMRKPASAALRYSECDFVSMPSGGRSTNGSLIVGSPALDIALSPNFEVFKQYMDQFSGESLEILQTAHRANKLPDPDRAIYFIENSNHSVAIEKGYEVLAMKRPQPDRKAEVLKLIAKGQAHADEEVRVAAMQALNTWDPENPVFERQIPNARELEDEYDSVAIRADQVKLSALAAELGSTDRFKRQRAAIALSEYAGGWGNDLEKLIAPKRDEIVAALPGLLDQRFRRTCLSGIQLIQRLSSADEKIKLIKPLLSSADPVVAKAASSSFIYRDAVITREYAKLIAGNLEYNHILLGALQDCKGDGICTLMTGFMDKPECSPGAMTFLSSNATANDLEIILPFTSHADAATRSWAIGLCKKLAPKNFDIVPFAVNMLKGPPPYDAAILKDLATTKPTESNRASVAGLLMAAIEKQTDNEDLAKALAVWNTSEINARLVDVTLKTTSAPVREALLPAAAVSKDPKVISLLLDLVESRSTDDLIATFRVVGENAEAPLLTMLKAPGASKEKRLKIIALLGEVGGKESSTILANIIRSTSANDRDYVKPARTAYDAIIARSRPAPKPK